MRNKLPNQKQFYLKFANIFKHISRAIKNHFSEIVTGVVIGIIILVLTPYVNKAIESQTAQQRLVDNLSSVSLGMSKNYIDGMFGQPVIETEYNKEINEIWFSNHYTEGTFISAGYKLADSVLLCLYYNKTLEAFVIVVNKEHLYRIPANMYISDCYLLDFTYADFSEFPDKIEGNVPANNDTYAYYSELHYGAGPANYNYFILGSYKDYREKTYAYKLMHVGQAYVVNGDSLYPYDKEEHNLMRKKAQPNVFGIVSSALSEKFNFVSQIVGDRENGTLLFSDWRSSKRS